jgi:integrase
MASIRKRNGKYQARIHRRGIGFISKTFLTRPDAVAWARHAEISVERLCVERRVPVLGDLLLRYARELSPRKKGCRSEVSILNSWRRSTLSLKPADLIQAAVLAEWRDQSLSEGKSGSTVRNHLNALSAVYRHAASEWGYQHLDNPVARLKRPSPGKARTRRTSDAELEVIKAVTQSRHLAALIDLAVETAMRLSELVNLRWRYIDLNARTAHLPDTKNGHPRTIPLSTKAVETFRGLRHSIVEQLDERVFDLTPHAVTVAFRRACSRAKKQHEDRLAADLRFHDLRHEAVSRLFERGLNPIEVASISGHRSMQMLARYTHIPTASLIAKLG